MQFQKNNFLSGLWAYGYDELRWKISYLGDGDKERITSTKDRKNYDLSLYPIPRAESVPEKLREIVDNPIFNISELTLDVVKARAYTLNNSGDSTGYRMQFSVLYGNILIEVSSKGVSPEWIYTQLTGMPH